MRLKATLESLRMEVTDLKTQTLDFLSGRKVVLAPFINSVDFKLPRPFAALLPANNAADCRLAEKILAALHVMGCIEICCVGTFAEQMHDQLDGIIESSETIEVVTTWFNDKHEACEYFLFAAGGGDLSLLAIIIDQPELVDLLLKTGHF
jgi:hypothetical protein